MSAHRGDVVARLQAAGCVAADEEADEIVRAAPSNDVLEAWLRQRERGEPLAWILGRTSFCGHAIAVDREVFVPRSSSEQLAIRAAALLPQRGAAIDLCTGSGAIAVHLMRQVPTATVVGVDVDPRAVGCARRNGVTAVTADLDGPLGRHRFDVVTAVAPYVPTSALALLPADVVRFEPQLALDGGADGLDIVRRVVVAAERLLRPGGWLLIEVGGDQDEALRPCLEDLGFADLASWHDDDGDLRGVIARANAVSPCPSPTRRSSHHAPTP